MTEENTLVDPFVDPSEYQLIFEETNSGKNILEELNLLYYDTISFQPNDPHGTSFNEGQRSVIQFIRNKIQAALKEKFDYVE